MSYQLAHFTSLTSTDVLVLGLFDDHQLPEFATELDQTYHGMLTRLASQLNEPGDFIWQSDLNYHRVLLIHCGSHAAFSPTILQKRITDLMAQLFKQRVQSATICLPQVAEKTADWQVEQICLLTDAQRYQFLAYKSKQVEHRLQTIEIYQPDASEAALTSAQQIAAGIRFTRDLANTPANICTPSYLAEQAEELAAQHQTLSLKVLDKNTMKTLGMGSFLAVAQGSIEPPKLIELQYQGSGTEAPIVLVGKGITFDSGGLSLKPADGMQEMKFDMAGAAAVLGIMKACALLELPLNVIGLMACAENLPSGTAVKPGDVVKSMSGQTIEIINTDAEGRLVLADTLTYAEQFNPAFVLDMATLTGAVVVALGHVYSGFMTKDDGLAELILKASEISGDKSWRLPLDEAYQDALDSPVADFVNARFDRAGGSITAACFLSRFTEKYRWAHLDIAGTAWISGKQSNATGRPVSMIMQILRQAAYAR